MPNVLYADDIFAEQFKEERAGYTLFHAPNGKEALEIIDAESIDLLLLDLHMPVMNGWEVLEALKEREFNLPVVVFSNPASDSSRREIDAIGYQHVLDYVSQVWSKDILGYLDRINGEPTSG